MLHSFIEHHHVLNMIDMIYDKKYEMGCSDLNVAQSLKEKGKIFCETLHLMLEVKQSCNFGCFGKINVLTKLQLGVNKQ